MADYVQLNYDRVLNDGLAGSNADANPTYDGSFIADGDIEYGVVISNASTALVPNMAKAGKNNVSATAGYTTGEGVIDIDTLKTVSDGSFKISVDGNDVTVSSLNFSSVSDIDDVVSAISVTGATVSNDNGKIKITSSSTGAASVIGMMVDAASGTSVKDALGFGTQKQVAGTDAVTAQVLGVVIRNVVDCACPSDSKVTCVKSGNVGAFRQDGTIKVLANESANAFGSVYFEDATGKIFATSGSGRTQLGSAIFVNPCKAGEIAIIDIRGLR